MSRVTGATNRGVRERDFGVLLPERHNPDTGVCLIEMAFLSNPEQARRLERDEYRDDLARELGDCIREGLELGGATATAFEKKFQPIDHSYIKKTLSGGTLTPAASVSVMDPAAMNPGFIDAATDDVKTTASLQTELVSLLHKDPYKKFVRATAATPTGKNPVPCKIDSANRIAVALVDLTGAKLAAPELAEWCSTAPIEGGSSCKILSIYALHQLLFDLQQLVKSKSIKTAADLEKAAQKIWTAAGWKNPPQIAKLFHIVEHPPSELAIEFPAWLGFSDSHCHGGFLVNDDCTASDLILALGFEYIGSVALQSGLRHSKRGGLWLGSSYSNGRCKAKFWPDSPVKPIRNCKGDGPSGHHLTALSGATYYTLAAQGRLADDATSQAVLTRLKCGCSYRGFFFRGLESLGSRHCTPSGLKTSQKCGIIEDCRHETMLVERDGLRYVAILITRDGAEFPFKQFIKDIDAIIDKRNPCPAAAHSTALDSGASELKSPPVKVSLQEIADGTQGDVPDDIRDAILKSGETDVDDLTNRVFRSKHPTLPKLPLDSKDPKQKELRAEWNLILHRRVKPLIWLRQMIVVIDKYRGDIPRDFLLGWIANESDGNFRTVSEKFGERGYFQIMWTGGEAKDEAHLSEKNFKRLSDDPAFSLKTGIQLAERYRQHIASNYPAAAADADLLFRLAKGRHHLPNELKSVLDQFKKSGAKFTWDTISKKLPDRLVKEVNRTMKYAANLKPLADLVPDGGN
jgi:hypothetical protein